MEGNLNALDVVRDQLGERLAEVECELGQLAEAATTLRTERKSIAGALKALSAKPERSRRSGVGKEELTSLIHRELSGNPEMGKDELKRNVIARLKESGRAATGVGLLLPHALRAAQEQLRGDVAAEKPTSDPDPNRSAGPNLLPKRS